MTPDEFFALQRALLEQIQKQNEHLNTIRVRIEFLAWGVVISIAIILGLSLK